MAPRPPASSGLHGILVVAKPPGPTSHDVVALVRRLAATKRVGHGGTLDPFAAGVLPVFLGKATRVVEFHMGDRKAYRATVCFGASSTTDDLEGELTPAESAPDREAVEAALPGLTGTIRQRPPAFSAIKLDGRRAYAIARSGQTPELAEREVAIHRLDLVAWDDSDPERPIAILDVECSAGTYIRALARDLGAALGGGAYLGALTRTASGPFRLDDAVSLDDVRTAAASGPDGLLPLLRPVDVGLDAFPIVQLDAAEVGAIARGQYVRPRSGLPGPAERYRVLGPDGALVAIAAGKGDRLAPDKVFAEPAPAAPAAPLGEGSES